MLNRIKYILLIIVLLTGCFSSASGQERRNDTPPLKERLFFGGNMGLQFGTVTDIEVSPVVGLWVLPRVTIATGPNYRFYKYLNVRTNIYGGRGYMQYYVVQDLSSVFNVGINTGIFLHFEDELLSLESSFWKNPPYNSERFFINTMLAGPGISQPVGRRSSINLSLLLPLNNSEYGLYSSPEFRIMFIF